MARANKRKRSVKRRMWIAGVSAAAAVAVIAGIMVLVLRGLPGSSRNDDNAQVTMENFQKLAAGQALSVAENFLGKASPVTGTEVEDAYADGAEASAAIMGMGRGVRVDRDGPKRSIRDMVGRYTIGSWMRWRNKSASIYAGIRQAEDGSSQIAVIGFLDYDVAARNYAAEWKVMPIDVEIGPGGVRTSISKPGK